MKTKQAFNPYLPSWEYVPDGEPHIVDGRVYVYGSHDLFNGLNFCLGDYVCWSAPVDDLGNWRYEGCIYKREQDAAAPWIRLTHELAAPDMVQGPDGKFYLYYFFLGGTKTISVARCDSPAGKYEFYGYVKYKDGTPVGKKGEPIQFDPGIFMDDDGRLYLYTGFALAGNPILLGGSKPTEHGPMCFELDPSDMLTVQAGPVYIGVAGEKEPAGAYEGHTFLEASSMRKFGDTYYFIYSSMRSHELCYAVSDRPTGGFQFGGTLVSVGDIGLPGITDVKHARNCTGNTHGSIIEINGKYYVFYHRHSNRKQSSRQAMAEEIRFEDGRFYQAEVTSCGLNGAPLSGKGRYPAYIACSLYGRRGTRFLSMIKHAKKGYPYLTQDGPDREGGPDQYIANMSEGAVAGFKYFDLSAASKIRINIKGNASGIVSVSTQEHGRPVARIKIKPSRKIHGFKADLKVHGEKQALFFKFEGKGSFCFYSFDLK